MVTVIPHPIRYYMQEYFTSYKVRKGLPLSLESAWAPLCMDDSDSLNDINCFPQAAFAPVAGAAPICEWSFPQEGMALLEG